MDSGKYIIIDDFRGGETPILFPCFVEHSRVAEAFSQKSIVSAGRFDIAIEDNKMNVWADGKSVSMGIDSRKEDAIIIKRFLCRNIE